MNSKQLDALIPKALNVAETLKALAHETRLLAVCFIGSSEKTVQELEEFLGTTQSNVSQHLTRLKAAKILECRREGKQVYYKSASPDIFKLILCLQSIYCPAPNLNSRAKGRLKK